MTLAKFHAIASYYPPTWTPISLCRKRPITAMKLPSSKVFLFSITYLQSVSFSLHFSDFTLLLSAPLQFLALASAFLRLIDDQVFCKMKRTSSAPLSTERETTPSNLAIHKGNWRQQFLHRMSTQLPSPFSNISLPWYSISFLYFLYIYI